MRYSLFFLLALSASLFFHSIMAAPFSSRPIVARIVAHLFVPAIAPVKSSQSFQTARA
jgi:hypothetical protein